MAEVGRSARGSWRSGAVWHGAGYLLVGGGVAVCALPLAVLVTVGALTTVVLVGGLLLLVTVPLARRLAAAQRRRTGRWTGHSVPELYNASAGTVVTRIEAMVRDPATWRDLLWLWLVWPVALLGALLCWVPLVCPWLARLQATLSRRLLSPTARSLRRAARGDQDGSTGPATSGHGLVGMRERVTVLGGTLTAGPRDSGAGFEIVAELPIRPQGPRAPEVVGPRGDSGTGETD